MGGACESPCSTPGSKAPIPISQDGVFKMIFCLKRTVKYDAGKRRRPVWPRDCGRGDYLAACAEGGNRELSCAWIEFERADGSGVGRSTKVYLARLPDPELQLWLRYFRASAALQGVGGQRVVVRRSCCRSFRKSGGFGMARPPFKRPWRRLRLIETGRASLPARTHGRICRAGG